MRRALAEVSVLWVSARLLDVALLFVPASSRRQIGGEIRRMAMDDVEVALSAGRLRALRAAVTGALDVALAGIRERVRPSHALDLRGGGLIRIGSGALDVLRQDVRFVVRSLGRQPAFTLLAVLTLAIGIGATTATFSVLNGVVIRGLPYDEPESLVRVWLTSRQSPAAPVSGSVSPVVFDDWRERATSSFESMASWARSRPTLTGMGEAEVIPGAQVTTDFFRVFRSEPALGRSFRRDEGVPGGPRVVVVSWGFWQGRLGAAADVLDRTIELNGQRWQVVGVAPADFDYPEGADLWMPVRNNADSCDRSCVFLNTVARLRPGVSLAAARSEMASVSDALSNQFPAALINLAARLDTLKSTMLGDVSRALWFLLGAVVLVLLIACANVANLLIARGATRADEIAVRAALGAGRPRIVRQLLTESTILSAAGAGLGLGLAVLGVRAVRHLSISGIPRIDEVGLDANVIGFTAGAAILTTLLFGFVPAIQSARSSVAATLRRESGRTAGSRNLGRSTLLAVEVALSLVLLVGAGLLLRSFASIQRIDPGFTIEGVSRFSISLPGSKYETPARIAAFFDELQDRLLDVNGVSDVGRTLFAPLTDNGISTTFFRTDMPAPDPGAGPAANLSTVDDRFFDVFGIEVLAGRAVEATDRNGAPRVVVINRSLAERYFPGEDPIGRSVSLALSLGMGEREPRRIVGIVADVRTNDLKGDPEPEMFVPFAQSAPPFATFLVRARLPLDEVMPGIRDVVRGLDPELPLRDAETIREVVSRQTARARFYLTLLALFASMAVVLAAVGLYGVVSCLVTRRRREIGVRVVLGASPASVIGLVLTQGLRPAFAGAAVGLVAAFAGVRVMESLLFGVEPLDPPVFFATSALLLGVVVVACLVPAIRATRIAPGTALRSDR